MRTFAISGSRPYANHTDRFYRESAASLSSQSTLGRDQLDRRDNASTADASFSCARIARHPTTIQKIATPTVDTSVSTTPGPKSRPTSRSCCMEILFPIACKPRALRTKKLSSSQPTDPPYRRALSRVCSNAWFALSLHGGGGLVSSAIFARAAARAASMSRCMSGRNP